MNGTELKAFKLRSNSFETKPLTKLLNMNQYIFYSSALNLFYQIKAGVRHGNTNLSEFSLSGITRSYKFYKI